MFAATRTFACAALMRPFCATAHMLGSDAPFALNPKLTLNPKTLKP